MCQYYVYMVDTKELVTILFAPKGLDKSGVVRWVGYPVFWEFERDDGGHWRIEGRNAGDSVYYAYWDDFDITTEYKRFFLCL